MKRYRRQVNNRLGTFAFKAALRWVKNKDILEAERAGMRLGRLAHKIDRKHRERAISNLALAFPEKPAEWHEEMARKTFEHFGLIAADFLRSPQRSDQEVLESVESVDLHYLQEAKEAGKGAILLTAHLGNWERVAQFSGLQGFPLTVVARDANDQSLNQTVLNLRKSAGLDVLSRGNAARGILGKLRENGMVAILADQNAGEAFVPFFGHPCGTVIGPGVLTLRSGAALIPGFCLRVGPGKYVTRGFPPITSETAEERMKDYHAILESVIREYPDQYLWLHDRWKSARQQGML